VLARLKEIDANVGRCSPFGCGSSLTVVAIGFTPTTAYYEDEVGAEKDLGRLRFNFDPTTFAGSKSFKEFWEKGAREFDASASSFVKALKSGHASARSSLKVKQRKSNATARLDLWWAVQSPVFLFGLKDPY